MQLKKLFAVGLAAVMMSSLLVGCSGNKTTVIFPTETVYGLGANALDEDAVSKIYEAKGRPSDNPLIVHIGNKKQIYNLVCDVPEQAEIVMDKFWPGPITII